MRVLYVKQSLVYPRSSGHDVSCYYMMRAMANLGAEVSLLTVDKTTPQAIEGMTLAFCGQLSDSPPAAPISLTWAQERFRSFWGISQAHIASVRSTTASLQADVVVAYGLPALPYLAGAGRALRVWAMADEWIYHHLSLVQLRDPSSWHHVRAAAIKGTYERVYRSLVDRFWAVSDTDLRAGHWLAGMKTGDLLPNGVDADYYRPMPATEIPHSAVFWGRLDFEPNIDALRFFCRDIWPGIRLRQPEARFTVIGYNPTPQIAELAKAPGITLLPNVEDLRKTVCEHALVVLPMVSGGGIKNKLLEGAAMGRPIVCTPRAAMDLRPAGRLPLAIVSSPTDWQERIIGLWNSPDQRASLGHAARSWIGEHYSWDAPARAALAAFEEAVNRRGK